MEWNETNKSKDNIYLDIPIGRLCCFKPLTEPDRIYFGHLAGIAVDNFGDMSFVYILCTDKEYFFSKEVIERPIDVNTYKDAEKYF